MTETLERPTTEATTPRWRLVVFWLLLVVLLVLHLGERPRMLVFPFVAFDGGDHAGHEIHLFAQGAFAWLILGAFISHLRRPAARIGALWSITAGTVVAFALVAGFADLPPEIVPILLAAIAVAVVTFFAHPASLRAKIASVDGPSPVLGGLAAVGAVPLLVYAVGQINIHLGSGLADEHYAFGHWVVMAAVALVPVVLAAVAAAKVAGWRFPLWAAGLMVAGLGIASVGLSAASQLSTLWALSAIGWGAAFVAAGELEARRRSASQRRRAGGSSPYLHQHADNRSLRDPRPRVHEQHPHGPMTKNEQAYRQAERAWWDALAVTPTEHRIHLERNDVTIRVQEAGQGVPVLFLHGGPGACGTVFAALAARLPDRRCLLLDRPGTGLSDPNPLSDPAAVLHECQTLVVDVLDALGLERAHLVGSSHGGYAALLAAALHPDRVDRMVLLGAPGLMAGVEVRPFDRLILAPGVHHLLAAFPMSERGLRKALRQLGHPPDLHLEPAEIECYVAQGRYTDMWRNELASMANMGTFRGGFDPTLWVRPDLLEKVEAPTVLLWGALDVYGGQAVARHTAATLPDAELDLVDGGHLIWLDDPDHAAEVIHRQCR